MTNVGPEKPGPGRAARDSVACPRGSLSAASAGTGRNRLAAAGFSKDLCHDFRTPLNVIIGFSELLLEEIPGKLNEEQRLDLTDILNSGQRLLGLVNAMLERFDSGAGEIP
jgi:signal transduction histidine kinase